MSRKQDPSAIFSGRYAVQLPLRSRRHERTGTRRSVKKPRQATLRLLKVLTSQPERPGIRRMSDGRRQRQLRPKKPNYRMELQFRVNQIWSQVRSRRTRATSKCWVCAGDPGRRSLHRQDFPYAVSISEYRVSGFTSRAHARSPFGSELLVVIL